MERPPSAPDPRAQFTGIEAWLASLHLERYARVFREHDVDLQVLRRLTPEDLTELGVVSVGHRRRLLHAISALGEPEPPLAPAHAVATLQTGQTALPELRQLTVLFCDLVGSTALSARLDLEDMRSVIRSYHAAGTEVVKRYEGHVANFIGDGFLVYFGWPQAHEDDAERAVRVGLKLAEAVSALATPMGDALCVRVGISTGSVVVGDLIREGPAQEQSAVGATPHLAAELQTLAAPGQVIIDGSTHELLGSGFAIDTLTTPSLAGFAGSVAAFAVRGERPAWDRFDARSGVSLPPIVGRDHELALLVAQWNQAVAGDGQGMLLVGEAGIGKSRLCRALLERIAEESPHHYCLRYQCSPHHTDSALWPVIHHIERLTRLGPDASADARLDRLEALVDGDTEVARLLADLLELDGVARYGRLDIAPRARRERTLEALVKELLRLASLRPVIVLVEDAHWADPTTLELIDRWMVRVDGARAMVLLSSRPENEPKLGRHRQLSRLMLQRLGRSHVEAIVHAVSDGQLMTGTVDMIVERTDGVPLFAEEITRATLEAGGTAVPASLYGSLMARLDRIPDIKQLAQIAACIGREFDIQLLASAGDWSPSQVSRAIEGLVSAQLVLHRGDRKDRAYSFKHALLQEAAYESLLHSKRRELHSRVLRALEERQPSSPPELLAHHAARAGLIDKGVEQWGLAGMLALGKSAYVEAASHLSNAIALLRDSDAPADERRARELRLQVALGQARMATSGYGAETTRRTFELARELLDIGQDTTLRISVLYGLWVGHIMAVGTHQALQLSLDLLNAGQADQDEQTLLVAHRLAGSTYLESGDWTSATSHLERALAIYDADPSRHANLSALYGMDPAASACSNLAVAVHVAGFPTRASTLAARVRRMADSVSHAIARAPMYCECVNLAILQRDTEWMERDGEVFTRIAIENGLAMWRAYSLGMQAWRILESGWPADAVDGFVAASPS